MFGRFHPETVTQSRLPVLRLWSAFAEGIGVPYAMLLYERFLGRPFAGHRDSVSELVGHALESAIEEVLHRAGVSYRKTKRAERVEGLDQTPDFIVPSEFNPQVIIEAKLTEDDGTARDKVTGCSTLASSPPLGCHQVSTASRWLRASRDAASACAGGTWRN